MNNFGKLSDLTLVKVISGASTVLIEQFRIYGVTEDQVELLDEQNAAFSAQIEAAGNLENQRKAAVSTKDATRMVLQDTLSSLAGRIYANPEVTDAMLDTIGFAPRPIRGTRTTPQAPINLVANAFANGNVELKWGRNGNTRTTMFTLQFRASGGTWTTVGSAITSKITLGGFTPGQPGTFRARASVNGKNSSWSNQASIYIADSTSALKLAA